MAFNINAQVVLSGPKNIKAVRSNIKKQLSGVTTSVKIDLDKAANTNLSNLNKQLKTTNTILKQVATNATTANKQISGLANTANKANSSASSLAKNARNLSTSFGDVSKSVASTTSEVQQFGKDAALAIRRFSAFTIATGAVFGFVRAVKEGIKESIEFERQLSRVVQVTGATGKQIKGLESTIDGLAASLGLNANELAKTSVTLAQTGQTIDQVRKSITAISKASLAPTFGDIKDTTEGVIAALNQFNIGAGRTEAVLGSLNAVSKRFAVESEDLISVIRRAGGVFATAAGDIKEPEKALSELIGLFTAVRSTTRESADTIATGLRTIFARIQRKGTIDFLKGFNIELTNAQGQFVGFFEGFRRISEGLKEIQQRGDTITLGRIVEELGGIRQIGKLLPVLQNFEKAQEAYNVALSGTDSISKDVAIATQTLSVQIQQLQARFQTLIKDISQSTTFQRLASFALSTANAFITLADALRPLIPLLTTFATIKISGAILDFSKGFIGGIKRGGGAGGLGSGIAGAATGQRGGSGGGQLNLKPLQTALSTNTKTVTSNTSSVASNTSSLATLTTSIKNLIISVNRAATAGFGGPGGRRRRALGGSIPRFQRGGFVNGPGHAQGGVVAELEGGEFVVPKKQVQKFTNGGGKKPVAAAQQGRLRQLEISGANDTTPYGVTFLNNPPTKGLSGTIKGVLKDSNQTGAKNFAKGIVDFAIENRIAKAGTPSTVKEAKKFVKDGAKIKATSASVGTFNPDEKGRVVFEDDVEAKLPKIVNDAADSFFEKSGVKGFNPANFKINQLFSNSAIGSIQGQYFEAFTRAVLKSPQVNDGDKTDAIFDFETAPEKADLLFTAFAEPNEFKNAGTNENINSAIGKGLTLGDGSSINFETVRKIAPKQKKPTGRNTGGSVDTANSLLTPGEAVFGAKKASQIGINNLTRLNKTGDASGLNISNSDFSIVPGSGNSDTVPASLEPGSFVIKKSSTQEGLQTFNSGGKVQRFKRGGQLERFQGGGAKGGGLGGGITQLALFASFADLGESANQLITLFFGLETALSLFGKDLSDLGKGLKKQSAETKKLTDEQRKSAKRARSRRRAVGDEKFGSKRNKLLRRSTVIGAGRGRLLERGQALGGRGKFSGARALSSVGRGVGKIAGKGGLVAIVASLLVDPITQAIKTGFGEVELETGQKGFRGPKGLETAQAIGFGSGAVSGGLAGAGLGGLVGGPVGALIGGIAGAAVGGIKGIFDATASQLEFQAFDQFNKALGESTKTIDEFNKNASVENLGKLNQATAEVFLNFERLAKNTIEARESSFSSQLFGGLDTNIFDSFSTASGIYEKSVFLFDKASQFFGGATSELVKSIERQATLQKRGSLFGDVLNGIAPQIEKIAQANVKGIETVFNAIPLDQLKALDFEGIDSLDGVKDQLTALGVGAKDAEAVLSNLETSLKVEAINQIASELPATAKNAFLGAAAEAIASGKDISEAVKAAFSSDQLDRLGLTAQQAEAAVARLADTVSEKAVAELIRYQQEQVELNRILSETSNEIDAFGAALQLLSGGIAGLSSDFSTFLGNIQSDLDASLTNDFSVRRSQQPNVFENVTGRIPDEINNAVDNLADILNTDVLEGASEIINLQNELPRALKDTVNNLAAGTSGGISGAGQFTDEQILDEFKKTITDFDKLPSFVQQNLEATLKGIVGGSRQGEGGKGAVSLQKLLEEGNFDQLNQISVEFAENLSEIQSAVNDFQNAIAQGANNIKKINNLRLRTDLEINAKRQSFEDRFGQFLNQNVDERAKVEKRLRDSIDAQLRAGTGGPGIGAGGIDAGALAARRQQLLNQRDNLNTQLENPELGQAEFDALTKALGDNASQLDGTTAALKTLSEDVTQLEAVEGQLAKIQESRLTGRERARLFASRAQDAGSPRELQKLFQEFLAPTIAVAKAQQGTAISFGEAAAILGDPQQIQDVFGFDDTQIEGLLARTTGSIGDSFANLLSGFGVARNAGPIARGLFGAGATEQGSTAKEQELLAEATGLQLEREKALLALRDQNITSAETLQQQFSDLIATTSQGLSDLVAQAEQLRFAGPIPPSTEGAKPAEQDIAEVFRNAIKPLDDTSTGLNNAAARLQAAGDAIIIAVQPPPEVKPVKKISETAINQNIPPSFPVFRQNGGSIFEPKGTDTVPAMLTPGEFVVNAKATRKGSNLQLLKDINNGKLTYAQNGGLIQYFDRGGETPEERLRRVQAVGADGFGDLIKAYIPNIGGGFGGGTGGGFSGGRGFKEEAKAIALSSVSGLQAIARPSDEKTAAKFVGATALGALPLLKDEGFAEGANALNSVLGLESGEQRDARKRRENESLANQQNNVRREEGRRKDEISRNKVQAEIRAKFEAQQKAIADTRPSSGGTGTEQAILESTLKPLRDKQKKEEDQQKLARQKQQEAELFFATDEQGNVDANQLSGANLEKAAKDAFERSQRQRLEFGLIDEPEFLQQTGKRSGKQLLPEEFSSLISGAKTGIETGKNIFSGAKALTGAISKGKGFASKIGGLFTQPQEEVRQPVNPLRARQQARFGTGAGRAAGRRIDVARPADARQQPAISLQQQENLTARRDRIARVNGPRAAQRFSENSGLANLQQQGRGGQQQAGQIGQDLSVFADSVTKLQDTTKSLTAFATQLNTAADKLAQLQTIEVSLNATVAPIEVVLNGASIINEFGDTAKKEIYNQLVTKLEDEFVKKTTDGSVGDPSLGGIA